MIYRFRSIFNRDNEYTIECDEPLELYDDFSLSIKKVDNDNKSFDYTNIDCVLKYAKHGTLGIKQYELEPQNFNGFHMMAETFKHRGCLTMGQPIELIKDKIEDKVTNTTLKNCDEKLRLAFEKYIQESNIMESLFQCFLNGAINGGKYIK